MERLFIDESGSMTLQHAHIHPYFVIAVIRVKNHEGLRKSYKHFVRKNMKELEDVDENCKMFVNGKFKELKGNCLTPDLKRSFINTICVDDNLEVFFIVLDNRKGKPSLYENIARGFNYLLKLALSYWTNRGYLTKDDWDIQLDERNESPSRKKFLQEYLNTELFNAGIIGSECKVTYFDSANNRLIQVADVFANFYFSQLKTSAYTADVHQLQKDGYIKHIFKFPL